MLSLNMWLYRWINDYWQIDVVAARAHICRVGGLCELELCSEQQNG
ncbi:hypothetical Protein YC6258_01600 [Gynuella sunshinyii YC6258]|uniref:Uncharacterized protein n=1 Tax=Gynuella sunshinyii YC6258 TaxID=1445510 RepID=A0A0C5VJU1_9GAMM|nr:hypothetical Protein YC6258_01600 [Gynuella sunshinyii YC6258]